MNFAAAVVVLFFFFFFWNSQKGQKIKRESMRETKNSQRQPQAKGKRKENKHREGKGNDTCSVGKFGVKTLKIVAVKKSNHNFESQISSSTSSLPPFLSCPLKSPFTLPIQNLLLFSYYDSSIFLQLVPGKRFSFLFLLLFFFLFCHNFELCET